MAEKVYENIYKIEIPLPKNPLKALNSYVVKGKDKNLLIDTGFNTKECIDALIQGMEELEINFNNTELFITHLHADHSGLATFFQEKGVRIYAGEVDGELINQMTKMEYWKRFNEFKIIFDLEKDEVSFEDHPGYKYCLREPISYVPLREGKGLQVGEYFFEVIFIPGHTPGHIGLYERNHKLFFGGDHVLDRITPNIAFWGFGEDILATYFNSLGKIFEYDIDYLFPSHRNVIRDHRRRIGELYLHHKERLNEIINIIKKEETSVRDVASQMQWSIRAKNWEEFPSPQKWFATREAMSHLEHLYYIGKADKILKEGKLFYKEK
ncbi:MBL fold metallo-hydrolase [Tissierella sp. MSJ-40]|uniref:MBL fold metallo-hydrolase n=1 Tax=Tissierella simiarum TaxID=2841534 RepID=A0ABS6E4U5_9FIRM|nr:MBL fold metallo-hydrolase [Tissierella simiarum]MBU5437943.1 MBL fold metallo-hydrolase [Tissierella simiarum]